MADATSSRDGGRAAPRPGARGNERLTALAGAVLLVLLAVEGATIVFLRPLLPVHFFVGMLLFGPVVLKMGSTGYRFVRYYTGAPDYRRKGPPAPLLRLLGPLVVITSLAVLGTGAGLAFGPPQRDLLLSAHKASFVLWFAVMTVHVLAYVWRVPGLVAADLSKRPGRSGAGHTWPGRAQPLAGRAGRWSLVVITLAAGLAIAIATVHLAGPWAALGGGDH